ncbi:MAG: hypothetical protein LBE22_09205 [Azoarcus sp.]|jgi:hypothetical protein|nr:hypothetical protein [Azoarcus sp.]
MKIELTRSWCEKMARREIEAGLSDIEAGGMPVGNIPKAFLADTSAPMPLQASLRRARGQGAENCGRQELEKL